MHAEKCMFGQDQVKWYGNIYKKQSLCLDPDKVDLIKGWLTLKDKTVVKLFLQTIQFCSTYMKTPVGQPYSDVTKPLREHKHQNSRFKWKKDCETSFKILKFFLTKYQVMFNFDSTVLFLSRPSCTRRCILLQSFAHFYSFLLLKKSI